MYLIEHMGFYMAMLVAGIFTKRKDFRLITTRAVGKKYITYLQLTNRVDRDKYRFDNTDLDEWGVSVGIWTTTMTEKRRQKELTPSQRFREGVEESEKERKGRLAEIEKKLEGLE